MDIHVHKSSGTDNTAPGTQEKQHQHVLMPKKKRKKDHFTTHIFLTVCVFSAYIC